MDQDPTSDQAAPAPIPADPAETAIDAPTTTDTEPDVLVALDGEGLRLVYSATGRTRLLPFGAPARQVEEALEGVWGPPEHRMELPDCGYEPPVTARWPGGLSILLVGDEFVGWSADEAPATGEAGRLTTMAGVGIGTTRSEMEEANVVDAQETTLGIEFTTAGLAGVLRDESQDAEIVYLWAGRACIYR